MYLAILLGRKRRKTNNFITCLSFCNQNTLILPGLPSKLELLCEKGFELGGVHSGRDRDRDACCKIRITPMKETNLGVAQAPKEYQNK